MAPRCIQINAVDHLTTNFPWLQGDNEKYPEWENCGWGGPQNYTMSFSRGFYGGAEGSSNYL
jgi:hypothetical protein